MPAAAAAQTRPRRGPLQAKPRVGAQAGCSAAAGRLRAPRRKGRCERCGAVLPGSGESRARVSAPPDPAGALGTNPASLRPGGELRTGVGGAGPPGSVPRWRLVAGDLAVGGLMAVRRHAGLR